MYDLPDSLIDLQSMKRSISSENGDNTSPTFPRHHIIDSNTHSIVQEPRTNIPNLNDLSPSVPKTILRSQQQNMPTNGNGKTVTIHSQPEVIQLHSNTSSFDALSNPCYFTTLNDTIDQYDIEQQMENRVVISIRGGNPSADSTAF